MILAVALAIAVVFGAGTFLLQQRDMARMVVGVVLISNAAILFLIAAGLSRGAAPIYPLETGADYSDPLVQAMALTALVIGFGSAALILAMVYRIYTTHKSIDLDEVARAERHQAEALERGQALHEVPESEEILAKGAPEPQEEP